MADCDHSYRQLFSHPELIRDLLEGFVHEEWVDGLDLDTLEKVNGTYISDDLRRREDDIIWRVRLGGSWVYVYLLIEFQSTVDRYMAVRLLTYVGLLYQDLIKGRQLLRGGMLPPVLPLVLYNGSRSWNAALGMEEIIQRVSGELSRYRPDFRYLLLEERTCREEGMPAHNLAGAIFRLERSQRPEDIHAVVTNLIDWLKLPDQTSLRRAFTVWIRRVLLPVRLPGQELPEVNDLMEVQTMLAERVKEWTREWKEEGMQQGMQQGMLQDAREMVLDALETKFGSSSARLSAQVSRINDRLRLKEILRMILKVQDIEDLEKAL